MLRNFSFVGGIIVFIVAVAVFTGGVKYAIIIVAILTAMVVCAHFLTREKST